jgi:hypothetical protein
LTLETLDQKLERVSGTIRCETNGRLYVFDGTLEVNMFTAEYWNKDENNRERGTLTGKIRADEEVIDCEIKCAQSNEQTIPSGRYKFLRVRTPEQPDGNGGEAQTRPPTASRMNVGRGV